MQTTNKLPGFSNGNSRQEHVEEQNRFYDMVIGAWIILVDEEDEVGSFTGVGDPNGKEIRLSFKGRGAYYEATGKRTTNPWGWNMTNWVAQAP